MHDLPFKKWKYIVEMLISQYFWGEGAEVEGLITNFQTQRDKWRGA
jgi:hypothetical protein